MPASPQRRFPDLALREILAAKTRGEETTEKRFAASYVSKADADTRLTELFNISECYNEIYQRNAEHFLPEKLPHHVDDDERDEALYAIAMIETKAAFDRLAALVRIQMALVENKAAYEERFETMRANHHDICSHMKRLLKETTAFSESSPNARRTSAPALA
jgi:hypothetical protein